MDDNKAGQSTDKGQDGKENISAEQYHALQDKLEKVIAAQSGSDKKVAELLSQLETKEKEKQTINTEKLTLSEQIKLITEKLERAEAEKNLEKQKALALTLASGTNIPQAIVFRHLGVTDQETTERVGELLAWHKGTVSTEKENTRKETANQILSKGPTPQSGDSATAGNSVFTDDKVNKLPAADLKKLIKDNQASWLAYLKTKPMEPVTGS
jgi:hypothetical protein